MRRVSILVVFCLAGALCGCGPSTTQYAGRVTPSLSSRTDVFTTSTPRPNPIPTSTPHKLSISPLPSNTQTDRTPVSASTSTPDRKMLVGPTAPLQSLLVLDPIQIRSPGEDSKVVSPIPLELQLAPGSEGKLLRIELRGEDGTLLMRKIIDLKLLEATGYELVDQIDFEIPGPSRKGLLIVQIEQSATFPLAINSANLVFLSSGEAQITPPSWQPKAIDIQQPAPGGEGSDGMITIAGLVHLDTAQPLKVQLISESGKVVGQRLAGVSGSSSDSFRPFIAQVPYQVDQRTQSRVIVYRDDGPNGEITHLASLPVVLNP
jgi:hypothetical protein